MFFGEPLYLSISISVLLLTFREGLKEPTESKVATDPFTYALRWMSIPYGAGLVLFVALSLLYHFFVPSVHLTPLLACFFGLYLTGWLATFVFLGRKDDSFLKILAPMAFAAILLSGIPLSVLTYYQVAADTAAHSLRQVSRLKSDTSAPLTGAHTGINH